MVNLIGNLSISNSDLVVNQKIRKNSETTCAVYGSTCGLGMWFALIIKAAADHLLYDDREVPLNQQGQLFYLNSRKEVSELLWPRKYEQRKDQARSIWSATGKTASAVTVSILRTGGG